MSDLKIQLHAPAPIAHMNELHAQLANAGQALREDDIKTFVLAVTDHDGKMSAGCKGEIAFRAAHVSELWVGEHHRGQGLGTQLLARAQAYAAQQGCTRIHLETRSEAARTLYEKLGYSVFGKLDHYDGDIPFYYLEKRID